jgi:hypothetical protein
MLQVGRRDGACIQAGEVMRRQGVWRTLEAITGTIMIGLGLRMATFNPAD